MLNDFDIIVLGAGAAGLVAAIRAAELGRRVLVLEKNRKPGVKILMSGGTRCNVTHACDERGIVEAYGQPGKFLFSALAAFTVQDTLEMFAAEGVATKIEPTGKIFPVSNRALDVLKRKRIEHDKLRELETLADGAAASVPVRDEPWDDDQLGLLFACCHPALPMPGRVALTLRAGSVLIVLGLLRIMRVLEPEDHERFKVLSRMLPKPLAASVDKCMALLRRPKLASATSTNG